MITLEQKAELETAGYHLAESGYYHPSSRDDIYLPTVIYPDGSCVKYADDVTRKEGAYLTLDEQWDKAWEHYQHNR